MRKINTTRHDKIWGYEIWLYSSVPGKETTLLENGEKNQNGPLVKIIKAKIPLSVQVHPDDKWAQKLERQENGKSESWMVLDAKKGAKLVMGLKNYNKAFIKQNIFNNNMENNLKYVSVKKGDFFNIPAGLVHAIGGGVTIFEVQQPSDVTYRYYDYNRLENNKPRELHIEKALKVQKKVDYHLNPINKDPLTYKNIVGKQRYFKNKIFILDEDSIVIDLDNYESYTGEKGEKINFNNYCVVSYK